MLPGGPGRHIGLHHRFGDSLLHRSQGGPSPRHKVRSLHSNEREAPRHHRVLVPQVRGLGGVRLQSPAGGQDIHLPAGGDGHDALPPFLGSCRPRLPSPGVSFLPTSDWSWERTGRPSSRLYRPLEVHAWSSGWSRCYILCHPETQEKKYCPPLSPAVVVLALLLLLPVQP